MKFCFESASERLSALKPCYMYTDAASSPPYSLAFPPRCAQQAKKVVGRKGQVFIIRDARRQYSQRWQTPSLRGTNIKAHWIIACVRSNATVQVKPSLCLKWQVGILNLLLVTLASLSFLHLH